MFQRAFLRHGGDDAPFSLMLTRDWRGNRGGFTLLEICIVIFIMLLMLGALAPAIHSAFVEEATRADARELSVMVRRAMLQCGNEHRAYAIDLNPAAIALHPAGDGALTSGPDAGTTSKALEEDSATHQLDAANRIMLPDPKKPKAWLPVKEATWIFESGNLCPAPRVRIVRGSAWMEIGFNALTGSVEDEATYFP